MLFFSPIFRLYAWRDLKAFIPTGNQAELFLCQFSPTPQFRRALFLTPSPQWRICPRSLCPPLTSFFDCSLSCRQHAAYANTRSFIPETPPLNECNLKWGHTCTHLQRRRGGGWSMETRTYYNQWICMPSLTCSHSKHRTLTVLKRADRNMWCHRLFYLRGLFTQTDGSQTRHLRLEVVGYWCTFKKKIFFKTAHSVICAERERRSAAAHLFWRRSWI